MRARVEKVDVLGWNKSKVGLTDTVISFLKKIQGEEGNDKIARFDNEGENKDPEIECAIFWGWNIF